MKPITSIHAGGYCDLIKELEKQKEETVQKAECDSSLSVHEKESLIKSIILKFERLISNSAKNLYFNS